MKLGDYDLGDSLFHEATTINGPIMITMLTCKLCAYAVDIDELDVHEVMINGSINKVTECPECGSVEVYEPMEGALFYSSMDVVKRRYVLTDVDL